MPGASAPSSRPTTMRLRSLPLLILALLVPAAGAGAQSVVDGAEAQSPPRPAPSMTPGDGWLLPPVEATHARTLALRTEEQIRAALLAGDGEARDRHLDAAELLARSLVTQDPGSAEAHYWLAVALGVKTESANPFQKLSLGKECFETSLRILELDPDHPGGQELMGRIHAGVMRLPWLVRKLSLSMGMGDALGGASWEKAVDHFRRAAELDPEALAPRYELGKLLGQLGREGEARVALEAVVAQETGDILDQRIQEDARALLEEMVGP